MDPARPRPRLTLALLTALALCLAPLAGTSAADGPDYHDFFLLSFDRYGQLANPYERDVARAELRVRQDVGRIVIVSYGWAKDAEGSLGTYAELVDDLLSETADAPNGGETVIFGIGWDSSQTGFRKLANDLVPLPVLADAAAFVPDRVLFPLSFWSKAAMADRIGYGGLRQTLNQIFESAYPDPAKHPDIYLIGHSFGTRILSGLVKEQLGIFPVGTEPFRSKAFVRGALWIQPALVPLNLPDEPDFPLLVTQNEHDHANGFLFPLGNILINAYAFTTFEALIQNRLFSAFEGAADTAKDSVIKVGSSLIEAGSRRTPQGDEDPPQDAEATPSARGPVPLPTRAYRATRRTGGELLSIPVALAFSVAATPVQYVYTQWQGLTSHPVDHVMSTLAQIPVVEVLVDGLGQAVGRDTPWGRTSKGLFALGGLHESVGRLMYPTIGATDLPIVARYENIVTGTANDRCGRVLCTGVQVVDLSDEIGGGLLGELRDPLLRYTVGWLDPIGMHSSTRDPEVRLLISRMLVQPDTALAEADGMRSPPVATAASRPAPAEQPRSDSPSGEGPETSPLTVGRPH